MSSKEHVGTVQRSPDRTATGQTTGQTPEAAKPVTIRKLSSDHADYWKSRLRKRSYRDRQGRTVEIPEWQARLFHAGKEGWFNLGTANAAAASLKARDISRFLKDNGWQATEQKFKPQSEAAENNMSIEKFADFYRGAVQRVEYPPSRHTAERYLKGLSFLCRHTGVNRIGQLTAEKIQEFKSRYLTEGRNEQRDDDSVKVSCNCILRNSAALFSKQMLAEYQRAGLALTNPFSGQKLRRIVIKQYSPLAREKLDAIWRDAAKLRDGDPDAKPLFKQRRKKGEAKGKRRTRWSKPDWTKPRPEAYLLLLLELGLGLRRHEADKAEWSWLRTVDGRHFLEVKQTRFFMPKSKERRVIPVEPALFQALIEFQRDASPFIVPGRVPKPLAEFTAKNIVYRCDAHHRALAVWLREHGIGDDKPCHLLRKEFGSYVATAFGLFHAQRLLGHSSPDVTSRFYAGLTQLPELNHAKVSCGVKSNTAKQEGAA